MFLGESSSGPDTSCVRLIILAEARILSALSDNWFVMSREMTPRETPVADSTMNSDGVSAGSSASDDEPSWIAWFCSLRGNEFFCEVDDDFLKDDFNLTGLNSQVTYYNYALDTILDVDIPEGELDERQQELVEVSAEMLYGLIHARYILTTRGLHAMMSKFQHYRFGRCPRVYCNGQALLPVGRADVIRKDTVKTFCPMCWDLFFPRSRCHSALDGAYWGTTFPHLFLHTYTNLVPKRNPERYVPRIYGFKIHPTAKEVVRNLELVPESQRPRNDDRGRRVIGDNQLGNGVNANNDMIPFR